MRLLGSSLTRWLLEHFRYVLGAIAVLVLLIGYVLLIGPEVKVVRQYGSGDLADETKNLEERQSYKNRLNEMLTKYDQLNSDNLGALSTVLPTEADFPDLFVIVEDVVTKSGLSLVSISISPTTELTGTPSSATSAIPAPQLDPNVKTLDIALTIGNGQNYKQFKELLTTIEDSLRLFNVQALSFSPPDETRPGETNAGTVWTVNLRTFFLVTPDESPS